jgi:hypothetical protein
MEECVVKRLVFLILGGVSASLSAQVDTCIDFEGFPVGADFGQGQAFFEDGVAMTPRSYTNGELVLFESAEIAPTSPHQGNSLALSNATLELDFGACVQEVTLHFGSSAGSGNLNVGVNGQLEVLKQLDPVFSVGGVTVLVNLNGSTGTMRFIAETSNIQTLRVGGAEFFLDHICFLPCDNPSCYDFESIGSQPLAAGDSFIDNGKLVEIRAISGDPGFAAASSDNVAGGLGAELQFNGVSAYFDLGCAAGVRFRYGIGERSAVLLVINGESVSVNDPLQLDGQTVGGVSIEVRDGEVIMDGNVGTLEIGGENLYIDNLCRGRCASNCIDFEQETAGDKFLKGDILIEDGIEMEVGVYQEDAMLVIEDAQRAGHLGQDAALNDATLSFNIPCAAEITLHFGQYAAGVRIGHAGAWQDAQEMTDFDGQLINGMLVEVDAVTAGGVILGTLKLTGEISGFMIGGQELVIDHVCHLACVDPGCVEFEVFPFGATYGPGDVLIEEYTRISVGSYYASGGELVIGDQNYAGGAGNEAVLTEAQVLVEFLCASRVEFLFARPPGGIGGVKLGVNGSVIQVNNFGQLHQSSLGGAFIQVIGSGSAGRVEITGQGITSVLIGGNNLAIDSICHHDCADPAFCLGFEGLPAGAEYRYEDFDFFETQGFLAIPVPFYPAEDDPVEDGTVSVSTQNRANHLGKELQFSNSVVALIPPDCMNDLSFRFGDYGGKVNLLLNGEQAIVDSLTQLDGTQLGGVSISVNTLPAPGGEVGRFSVSGQVTSLEIGGANLFVDHICYDECPDPLVLGRPAVVSVEPINATQRQLVIEIPVSGSGSLILQRSTTLNPASWSTHPATITTPAGRPDIRRLTTQVPLSQDKVFFRVVGGD